MFLEELAQQLKEHAARFDLENRAVAYCRALVRALLEEDPEETRFYLRGHMIDELTFEFRGHEFVVGATRSWPHVLSQVAFGFARENRLTCFGWYWLETVEEGEVNDDWFQWELPRDEDGKLQEFWSVEP